MKGSELRLLGLAAILVSAAVGSLGIGVVSISPPRVLQILLTPPGSATSTAADEVIVWQLRLPRILLASFIGAGLGMAGAGYQGLFRNPLADPFIIGASTGSALGATIAIILVSPASPLGAMLIPTAALAGGLLAVAAVYGLAAIHSQLHLTSLLLAGVAMSSFIGAVISLLMFLHEEKLATIVGWLMGSLSGASWTLLLPAAPLIVCGGSILWLLSRSLDSLSFGEETAASLGLHLARLRVLAVVAATLTTAAAVAAGGVIGFIGLIAPHAARLLVGAKHVFILPASALCGAILLLLADNVARTIAAPTELPIGLVTALLGSPFFLYLLRSRSTRL